MRTKAKVKTIIEPRGATFVIEAHNRGAFAELRRISPHMAIFRKDLDLPQYCLHRLFIPPVFKGMGMEHALLEQLTRWADRQQASIYSWASHLDGRPGASLSEDELAFYWEYGFASLDADDPEVMLRLPRTSGAAGDAKG